MKSPLRVEQRDIVPRAASGSRERSRLDFAVIVGVEHYPYFRSLSGAVNDARNFHRWLCDRKGGALKKRHAKLILSNLARGTPVQDEIDREILSVLRAAYALGGARRLYFYFSGHGAMSGHRRDNDVALLLTRWSSSLARLALSTNSYSNELCGTGLFEELAVFVDCCRGLSVPVVGVPPTITGPWEFGGSTRKFIACATEAGQLAFEWRDSGTWHGIFTQSLIALLSSDPEQVAASTLKDRLERDVEARARERGFRQRPYVDNGLLADSCFGQRDRSRRARAELWFAKRRGPVALRDGNLRIIACHKATDKPWRLDLSIGLYQIEGGGEAPLLFSHEGLQRRYDL